MPSDSVNVNGMTWSQAFAAYLERNSIPLHKAAAILGVAPSTVHYWTKGAEPRGEKGREVKQRVEGWTGGEVKAAPWAAPDSTTNLVDDEALGRAAG